MPSALQYLGRGGEGREREGCVGRSVLSPHLRALRGRFHVSPAHPLTCPLTPVALLLQPAASQLQGQGGIGLLVFPLQAQGQQRPPFLQGF